MSRLFLHMAPASPPSLSVMMLAEFIGVPLQCKMVKLLQLEQRTPEFKKLNPLSTVPVLEDGDFVVCDSHAILKYVVTQYGGDKREVLYPSEARARAVIDQRLFFNAAVFFNKFAAITVLCALSFYATGSYQRLVGEGKHLGQTTVSKYVREVTDALVSTAIINNFIKFPETRAQRDTLKNKFPRGAEWLSMIESEPVFQKVNAPGVAVYAKLLKKFWKKTDT